MTPAEAGSAIELLRRIAQLEARLTKYGGHTANCAYHLSNYKGPVHQCDCGWTELVGTSAQREVAK